MLFISRTNSLSRKILHQHRQFLHLARSIIFILHLFFQRRSLDNPKKKVLARLYLWLRIGDRNDSSDISRLFVKTIEWRKNAKRKTSKDDVGLGDHLEKKKESYPYEHFHASLSIFLLLFIHLLSSKRLQNEFYAAPTFWVLMFSLSPATLVNKLYVHRSQG